eukprot:Nitzschia sp. Nitz4//scaffold22_size323478//141563//142556//NITZ4_000532-RA/size323478-augustus-gene-0.236-mRNA-1//-1//CDS//3329543010//3606//frame0
MFNLSQSASNETLDVDKWSTDEDDTVPENKVRGQEFSLAHVDDDESTGWLGSISTDFRQLANCFKESTIPVLGGVATLVHNTAMAVAAEIAELERSEDEAEQRATCSLPLPWEIAIHQGLEESQYTVDTELMDAVLALSLREDTFKEPYQTKENFNLDPARVDLVHRLLEIDDNLSTIHARLAGRKNVQEEVFWRNYFAHCDSVRETMQNNAVQQDQKTELSASDTNIEEEEGQPTPSSAFDANSGEASGEVEDKCEDDSSLVPASIPDDTSYVLPSAPTSMNTFTSTTSYDDLVIVEHGGPQP